MPQVYSTAEVAQHLGIHHASVCRIIRNGKLPAQKIGKTWVVMEEDLARLARFYTGTKGRPCNEQVTEDSV